MTTSWLFGARVVRQTRRRASVSCDEEVLDSFGAGFVLEFVHKLASRQPVQFLDFFRASLLSIGMAWELHSMTSPDTRPASKTSEP